MATTTRLVLYKPVGTDLCNPVAHISDQMEIIDDLACKVLVTVEANPPVAEFIGQEWFTSDTKKFFYANNSLVWQQVLLPSGVSAVPSGRKGFFTASNASDAFATTTSQENGPQVHVECSVISGRVYKIVSSVVLKSPTLFDINESLLRMRVSSGASVVTTSGTKFYECHADVLAIDTVNRGHKVCIGKWTATFTGNASFGLFVAKTSSMFETIYLAGTTTDTHNCQYMAVEEVSA